MRVLLFVLFLLAATFLLIRFLSLSGVTPQLRLNPSVAPSPVPGELISFKGTAYRIFLEKIPTSSTARLIPNFTQKESAQEIVEVNHCTSAINGGFYDTNDQPLGRYFVNNNFLNPNIHNPDFLNGFVWADKKGVLNFTTEEPQNSTVSFLFQTGPYMKTTTNLRIRDDEVNRRMLLAKTKENEIYLLSMTQDANIHSGPLLAEVPQILALLPQGFVEAINLDGGSASAVITSNVKLNEIVAVGSLICLKN